ncbi:MAG: TolC family protein [Gammaproteobacteria bacterium]|nr:TolC family protein [Gammaproteobacteria bacterium]
MKFRIPSTFLALFLVISVAAEQTKQGVSLEAAVAMALVNNPNVEQHRARADSYSFLQEAADALPAPAIRTGLMNVPIDTFSLDVEPMSQSLIGVRQHVPPRGVRKAASLRFTKQAEANQQLARAENKKTIHATRTAWLTANLHDHAIALNSQARELLANLNQIVRARYAAGEELQLAVLAAELEQSRLDSRLLDIERRKSDALENLKYLIGHTEALALDTTLPVWETVPLKRELLSALDRHPKVQAADSLIAAEIAQMSQHEAENNPAWQFDVSYGLRSGNHPNEQSRADLASASVSVSVPWFAREQNQMRVSAARAKKVAAEQAKLVLLRNMRAEILRAYEDWETLTAQHELLTETLVPQASSHAQAALQAYQNKEGSYTEVLLSYVTEVETNLELHRVTIDRLQTWAKIDSLNGLTE